MAKRRPRFDSLEQRLCLSLAEQTTFALPQGSWTPTVYRASPIFVDIFGTGKQDLIAVSSSAQLVAYAENANGTATPIVAYQVPGGMADIKSTPIVVTDPSTGRQDLFAAMGRNEDAGIPGEGPIIEDGRLFGWDLQTGKLLPAFALGVSTGTNEVGQAGVYGSLTSGNLQGNGMPDIVATSFSHEVTAITLQGTVLWQWDDDDTIVSGAVVADLGRDGSPDVIVGGDSSASPYYQQGGWVNVLSNTGQLLWRRQIPGEVTWSSPVVADLNNNGYLDIVIGTGLYYSTTLTGAAQTAATAEGDYLYAFDPFGNLLPGWPYHTTSATSADQNHEVVAAPAVADLTGNGQLDVVALDRSGYIHVIQPNGQDLPGFAGGLPAYPSNIPQADIPDDYASPIIADVTGAGVPDIIATAGPFLDAFTPQGTMITLGTAPLGYGGVLPEGYDIAPAVGNFDGSGGLCLATVTYNATNPIAPNIPDQVQIYRLPSSSLTPPWPFLRRTISGDAVERSPAYDLAYVSESFTTLQGSLPSEATAVIYLSALNADTISLLTTAQLIATSLPVLDNDVTKVYTSLLGQATDAYALSYWSTYLETSTVRGMEELVAASPAFAQRAGGNVGQEVVLLYQGLLARTPSQSEINYWVGTRLPAGSIATVILNSSESISDQYNAIIQAMFGPNTQGLIPPDDKAAFSLEYHAGLSEAELSSQVLASAANFASTTYVAGYIASLYRDVLNRPASASEIAYWVSAVDNGTAAFGSLAYTFLSSLEAKRDFVQSEFQALLGISATPAVLSAYAALPNREDVVIDIVASPQYFYKNGGTNASFVVAAFRDLGAYTVDQATLTSVVGKLNAGTATQASVASSIVYGGLYFLNLTINQLMLYIPDEAEGVLRTGQEPANAAGQPINPPPNLINYFLAMYNAGESDEQVLAAMLTTPQYAGEVAYYRGLYRTPGIRF